MTPRKNALVWRLILPVAIAILPLTLGAQSGGRTPDDILKQESYQAPPREPADAVLAPRYLNVALTNPSPDKQWFLDEIGDGPVVMKTFSYPREFATQDDYDRPDRTFNKNSFSNFGARSMEYFTRLGYAVIDPDTPIVGPQGQMNNNYVNDLRNDLAATIDELDRRQIVDRQRLAIGGHSNGAFSTVNAMVKTPFFKAGIAGDGGYNRTLTPLGFQSERRDLWEAPNVYLSMSPFLSANNLTGALLMYHNLGDQNVGTDPTNSIRLYHALNGLGKTTALYLYPLEDHGPVAKETLLDLWARWAAWLEKYVKNPQKPEPAKKITTEQALVGR